MNATTNTNLSLGGVSFTVGVEPATGRPLVRDEEGNLFTLAGDLVEAAFEPATDPAVIRAAAETLAGHLA